MEKNILAVLLATGAGSALAHPAQVSAAQHGLEHLILGLAFALPFMLVLRRWLPARRLARRIRDRRN